MSETRGHPIAAAIDEDGEVLLNAADVVEHLRHAAGVYGSGKVGGSPRSQQIAQSVLEQVADRLQHGYIEACADAATETWIDQGGSE